ncbi:TELO2-interacting protein [Dirofilaria immitis]
MQFGTTHSFIEVLHATIECNNVLIGMLFFGFREIVPLKIMVEVGNDNYFRHIRITAQSICIKIISEFSQGAISPESVIEFSLFVKHELKPDKLQKEQLIKLYRIIFGTAFSILKGSMKTKLEFNRYTFDFALQILNNIFENLKVEEDVEDLLSFLWSVNSRCLIVGDSEISNAVDLERIATFEANFVRFMLSNTTKRKNLFSKEHQRELAFMITFFISKFCSQKVDMTIRLSLGNTLLELVKPWDESIETITSFLPGICCRMTKLACTDLNTVIVDMALKIFGCTVSTCLNDSIMHKRGEIEDSTILGSKPENSENVSGKNICYVENWNKNLKLLFRRMCSRLIQHQDYRIRLTLLVLLYDVYRYCTINLASSIENILIDAVLLLLCDPYEKIAKFSGKVKEYLMHTVNESFISRLMERLYSLSISISTETIVSGDVEGCLKQFLGVLLSMNSGCNDFLLIGGKLPELLTSALSSTLQLNAKRLRLSREVTEKSDVLGIIDELPLLYNVKKKTVNQIAMLLVTSKQSHVLLDCISANIGHRKQLDELTNSYHFAIYLLRAACTQISKPPQKFIDTLQVLVEQAVKLIERIDIHHPPRDDIIEDDNDEQDIESCLITVLLSFYAAAFICTPSIFLCQKLMNETLFEIFKWTKSSYLICAESAEHALKAATVAIGEADISSLCVTYGKYLLPKEWLILILRALLSFAMAIGKWFPDVRPQEIEYDEDNSDKKAPKPSFVESINNVLKRTKHLLFSSYVPIRLLILKIVDVCLKDLRYFPDDYLPMIHQNWLAVLDCLQMKNLNVRLAGFKVVVTMCELSGSFCYRRFIPQAWPSIRKFMLEQITTSANAQGAYFHSAIYKFQQAVLENLDVVFRYIEARNADWRSAVEMAKAYCDVTQPKTLQSHSAFLC